MWILMLLSLFATIIYQISTKGFNGVTTIIIFPTIVSIIKISYDYSSHFRVGFRRIKNFFNFDNYDIDFTAVFNVTDHSSLQRIKDDYTKVQTILYDLLKNKGHSGRKNELVEVSFDKFNNVKIYIKPYKIYFSIIQTDNFGQVNLNVNASATLKYKNGQEIIEDFIVRFYQMMCDNLGLEENKYTMKVAKNTKKVDFMKKHFIKEIKPSDILSFELNIISKPGVKLSVNEKNIVLVTSQRTSLINALNNVIKLIL
ncbi:hypothetical protein M5E03_03145 [Bacillus safensis]|uniref:hypothetical protein n=1 Tax=Bacillus safensis TaxID=561879 RepID=UPI0009C02F83|nr:hypothetical protein [Bacillus safensis]ARD55601.1 hypothetical protein BRL64_05225 [Bacillus safensis]USD79714.1 hypothetical protein M5E03_03145 [Bacillus safensis]